MICYSDSVRITKKQSLTQLTTELEWNAQERRALERAAAILDAAVDRIEADGFDPDGEPIYLLKRASVDLSEVVEGVTLDSEHRLAF